jgi:GTPase SAR1 family protein
MRLKSMTIVGPKIASEHGPCVDKARSSYIPLLLVGNKCDEITGREVSIQEGRALASAINCDFIETSTKTNFNV